MKILPGHYYMEKSSRRLYMVEAYDPFIGVKLRAFGSDSLRFEVDEKFIKEFSYYSP